jgi:hypothetical protein
VGDLGGGDLETSNTATSVAATLQEEYVKFDGNWPVRNVVQGNRALRRTVDGPEEPYVP